MYIQSIYSFPIKSCKGVEVRATRLDSRGLVADRRFMLIDQNGKYVTQRDFPSMALIEPHFESEDLLVVEAPGMSTLFIALRRLGERMRVNVWNDEDLAIDQGSDAALWFGEFLQTECRLVRIGAEYSRTKSHNGRSAELSFADHSPVVITTQESLDHINRLRGEDMQMSRFRPNIVIAGATPMEEYNWDQFTMGEIPFDVIRICDRCSIVSVKQENGRRECPPLTILPLISGDATKPVFGLHARNLKHGDIAVGDKLLVTGEQHQVQSLTLL